MMAWRSPHLPPSGDADCGVIGERHVDSRFTAFADDAADTGWHWAVTIRRLCGRPQPRTVFYERVCDRDGFPFVTVPNWSFGGVLDKY